MKVFISTGEVSGDLHGSKLVEALKFNAPQIQCYGLGSTQMRAAGVNIIADQNHHH